MNSLLQTLAAAGMSVILTTPMFATNWTAGTITLTWELSPPSSVAKGETFDATAACNYNANMAAGKEWEYGSPTLSFEWQANPDGTTSGQSNTATGGSGGSFSYKSNINIKYDTASTVVDDKTVKVRAHVTGTILDYGTDGVKGTADDVAYTIDHWSNWLSADLSVYSCDAISISDLTMYSINKTGISISATVTCNSELAPNLTVTFSCGALTFPGGATATTNAYGIATVTANACSTPSSSLDAETVTASVNDGIGNQYTDNDHFTLVKVNNPTPANPKILDGHYSDNSLYTIVLAYTVSPAISGVTVGFAFESGEGLGVDDPATLEDPTTGNPMTSANTDINGQAEVRVRSSDLRETVTIKGTVQESSGQTDVQFEGISSVDNASQEQ